MLNPFLVFPKILFHLRILAPFMSGCYDKRPVRRSWKRIPFILQSVRNDFTGNFCHQ